MSHRTREPGEVFLDARGDGRAMRLTWHHEADLVVLSLWRDHVCSGTFRLEMCDVADFVDALVEGLRGAPGVSVSRPSWVDQAPSAPGPRPAGLPPRQRRPHDQRRPDAEPVDDDQKAFTDWAFGDAGSQRAAAS